MYIYINFHIKNSITYDVENYAISNYINIMPRANKQ